MQKTRTYLAGIAIFAVLGIFSSAEALTVSPTKVEITADPGQVVQGEIEIFNEQGETRVFYTSSENFESRGDSGAPYFTGSSSGLATWITTNSSVTIDSGERILVPYTITIPSTARPGGYFAAIFFGTDAPVSAGGGEVSIGGKIGVLILLRVSGPVEEKAGLGYFTTKENSRIYSSLPVIFEYGFTNDGGDRVVPRGEIVVRNTFRMKSVSFSANEREGSVLPQSTRRFEVIWGDNTVKDTHFLSTVWRQITRPHIGWYTAEASLAWGASGQTASSQYHFFIFPWQLLSVVGSVVLISIGVFRLWVRRLKRRILAEALRAQQ